MAVLAGPKPTGASEPPFDREAPEAGIDLYWLPLGAGAGPFGATGASTRPSTHAWSAGGRWTSTTPRSRCASLKDAS
jgi:hypothetical protein